MPQRRYVAFVRNSRDQQRSDRHFGLWGAFPAAWMTEVSIPFPFAEVDYPSYSVFPVAGLAALAGFASLAAVGGVASTWIRQTTDDLELDDAEWLAIGFPLTAGGSVAAVLFLGPIAIPVFAALLLIELFLFFKKRDAVVAEQRQFLRKGGLRALRSEIQTVIRRTRAGNDENPAEPGSRSLTGRFSEFRERLQKSLARPPKSTSAAGARKRRGNDPHRDEQAPPADSQGFIFLKKDGAVAVDASPGSSGLSDNIHNTKRILQKAMELLATDVHFEPHDDGYAARLRVDGVLIDADSISTGEGKGVAQAIKVMSDMNIAERRRPQDGTFSIQAGTDKYDVRVASSPTSYGEKLVLRLLKTSGGILSTGLDGIGVRKRVLEQLRAIIHKPYGMFLVAGPTGSGKTTTVYAALSEIDAKQHNITTIEDPVEYRLDNITQIAVNTKADVSFASILRSVLRQDPDVLLVGEIRDRETAEIACQAALTGHFVFSTLHANDSVATITRLLDLGLDPTLLQTAVTAVLGQRLARRLCKACKEPCEPPPGLTKKFNLDEGAVKHIYREKGCSACGGTGYKGRIGLHELLIVTDEIREQMTAQPSVNALKAAAIKNGTVLLQLDGFLKVLQGHTSVSEILRVTT
jgi:type II secretory ATPase GspE/PulE/Tfp pilus assembly ATPase PilB-like protein